MPSPALLRAVILLSALSATFVSLASEPGAMGSQGTCEAVAAVVDGVPLPADQYALLHGAAGRLGEGLWRDAPIDGGRYWTRADYSDGFGAAPYPHYGCFADVRYLVAWFCQADRGWVAKQWGCAPRRRSGFAGRPSEGCVRTRLSLREPIIYCAPGHSPRTGETP